MLKLNVTIMVWCAITSFLSLISVYESLTSKPRLECNVTDCSAIQLCIADFRFLWDIVAIMEKYVKCSVILKNSSCNFKFIYLFCKVRCFTECLCCLREVCILSQSKRLYDQCLNSCTCNWNTLVSIIIIQYVVTKLSEWH